MAPSRRVAEKEGRVSPGLARAARHHHVREIAQKKWVCCVFRRVVKIAVQEMLQLQAVGATSTDDNHPLEHCIDGYLMESYLDENFKFSSA